jgi:hypothetical protein
MINYKTMIYIHDVMNDQQIHFIQNNYSKQAKEFFWDECIFTFLKKIIFALFTINFFAFTIHVKDGINQIDI